MSDYPDKVYIKSTDLFDNHTAVPKGSFAKTMYVSVNPWFYNVVMDDAVYIREDLHKELQDRLDSAVELIKDIEKCDAVHFITGPNFNWLKMWRELTKSRANEWLKQNTESKQDSE